MISSVPLISPRDAHSLWYTPSRSFALTSPSTISSGFSSLGASQSLNPTESNQARQNLSQPKRNHVSPLAQLALDEQSVEQRKLHIQRFGATWIRPPGFQKTLQGELDERAERAEAERLALLEEQAAGDEDIPEVEGDEDEHAGVRVVGNIIQRVDEDEAEDLDAHIPEGERFEGDEGEGTEDEEVDLDEEIPEAEADYDLSDEEDSDDSDDTEEPSNITPNQYMRPPPMPMLSSSVGIRTDSSPRQAMFSHDDRFGQDDSFGRADLREYSRRYQSEAMSEDDDEMEVDSDS